ncbi:MAG: S1 RNA-binding domain-containing protein, partial [Anaerolineae bacterium]|nr:S1 RNA-binding domain-containing protein [Anaerolineae bacterium]
MEEKEIQDLDEGSVEEGWWQSVLADEETFAAGAVVIDPVEDPNNIDDQEKWSKLFDYLGDEAVISVKVFDFNRGGLLVKNDEIQGFIPISHLVDFPTDLPEGMRPKHFKKYMETDLNVKVIECDPKRGRVVLSERAAETAPGERQRLFKSLKMGDVCSGRVTNITEFGVFV